MNTNFDRVLKRLYKKTGITKESCLYIKSAINLIERNVLIRDFNNIGSLLRVVQEIMFEALTREYDWSKHNLNTTTNKQGKIIFDEKSFSMQNEHNLYDCLVKNITTLSNEYSHFSRDKVKIIFNELRIITPKIEDLIELLNNLYLAFTRLIELETGKPEISSSIFNRTIYNDVDSLWNTKWEYIGKYENTKCKLCNSGELCKSHSNNEDDKKLLYPYGPILVCNSCKGILSPSLRLKHTLTDKRCDKCDTEIKHVYDYNTNESLEFCNNSDCLWSRIRK